ncbi:MAG: glycoside hydrolase family 76 protein [Melioribacteraceae bacterium]|nr:glycoside hydrolase family 76 protein [Melioribacteraceae bacterium]
MKFYKVVYSIIAVLLLNCSSSDGTINQSDTAKESGFTSDDATIAFEAFNKVFYNQTANLYYHSSDQDKIGAIWTQAIFWDIVMDAYERTEETKYRTMIDDMYLGGFNEYDGYNWENHVEWFIYDDMMWWIISLARAHEITGNRKYLDASVSGFYHVWSEGRDADNGGMFWAFDHGSKNSCINFPTVIAALRLYKITGDNSYLEKAKSIYEWSRNNIIDLSTGRVADHKNMNGHIGWDDYTYNQGTCIGSAVMLYKATNENKYLEDAVLVADYTKNIMCDSNQILPKEGDWNEQGVLKAIFSRYIMMLINDCGQAQYLPWIQKNADTAWKNRDKSRNITYRDYSVKCPSGTVQSYEASSAVGLMQICPPTR